MLLRSWLAMRAKKYGGKIKSNMLKANVLKTFETNVFEKVYLEKAKDKDIFDKVKAVDNRFSFLFDRDVYNSCLNTDIRKNNAEKIIENCKIIRYALSEEIFEYLDDELLKFEDMPYIYQRTLAGYIMAQSYIVSGKFNEAKQMLMELNRSPIKNFPYNKTISEILDKLPTENKTGI